MEIKLSISNGSAPVHEVALAKWLDTIAHAALSGIALTTAAISIDPATFNLAQAKHLGMCCLTGALIGLFGLLRQSPLAPKAQKPETPEA
jgi:hypothetical protein